MALLRGKGVKEGFLPEAVEKALRTLQRNPAEPVRFVAARGVPPHPQEPERFTLEPLAVPARLEAFARGFLAEARLPEVFRLSERRVQKKKKVLKKPALGFLKPKEVIETVVVKELVREKAADRPGGAGFRLRAQGSPGGPRPAGRAGQGRAQHLRASAPGPAAAGPGAVPGNGTGPPRPGNPGGSFRFPAPGRQLVRPGGLPGPRGGGEPHARQVRLLPDLLSRGPASAAAQGRGGHRTGRPAGPAQGAAAAGGGDPARSWTRPPPTASRCSACP